MPTTPSKAAETAPVTVLLANEQLAQLDEVAAVIRRTSGRSVSRFALLRAITAAVLTLRTDWKLCRNEDEVCLWILARLSATLDRRGAEQKLRQLKPGTNLVFYELPSFLQDARDGIASTASSGRFSPTHRTNQRRFRHFWRLIAAADLRTIHIIEK